MQSKLHSFYEALLNTFSGFVVSLALQMFLTWAYDLPMSFQQNLWFTLAFTAASVARSYCWRRYFVGYTSKKEKV